MKISLIIPVYNVAPYLRACLDSVAGQSYTEWECVCVDDGSTDGSGAILDEYVAKDSRFIVIHQKNSGVSMARNRGFEASYGDWVLFMDSDDVIIPNALAKVADAIARDNCEMVTFEMCRVNDVHEVVPARSNDEKIVHDMSNKEDAVAFVQKNFPGRLWAWNKCIKRSLIGDLRFENYQPCEDAVFVLTCMLAATKIIELPDVFYKYLQHEGSCLAHVTEKRINGDLCGWQRLVEVMLGWKYVACVQYRLRQILKDSILPYITREIVEINVDDLTRRKLHKQHMDFVRTVFCDLPLYRCIDRIIYRVALVWSNPLHAVTWIKIASAFMDLLRSISRPIRQMVLKN